MSSKEGVADRIADHMAACESLGIALDPDLQSEAHQALIEEAEKRSRRNSEILRELIEEYRDAD